MRILHTESSSGWGGQEIRILREAEGMRQEGHEILFAVAKGGGLVTKARERGFIVHEMIFKKRHACPTLRQLCGLIRKEKIDCVNTHSSMDAWFGGLAARITGKKIVRTRHLSTPIRKGLNSRLLYGVLADYVVTTSAKIVPIICEQAKISHDVCHSIPTGIDPISLAVSQQDAQKFRSSLGLQEGDFLVGTACFVRSWKGIKDLMQAAQILKNEPRIKWVIVGGGYVDDYRSFADQLGLQETLFFTGHLESPYVAIAAMDLFALLSTAHEGVSQASLQAAYLGRPLLTTDIGGLPEVCLPGQTGRIVPPFSPGKVAEAVLEFFHQPDLCCRFGENAKRLVEEKFTFDRTLREMKKVFTHLVDEKESKR